MRVVGSLDEKGPYSDDDVVDSEEGGEDAHLDDPLSFVVDPVLVGVYFLALYQKS